MSMCKFSPSLVGIGASPIWILMGCLLYMFSLQIFNFLCILLVLYIDWANNITYGFVYIFHRVSCSDSCSVYLPVFNNWSLRGYIPSLSKKKRKVWIFFSYVAIISLHECFNFLIVHFINNVCAKSRGKILNTF